MDTLEQINEFKKLIEDHYLDQFYENLRKGKKYLEIDYSIIAKTNIRLADFLLSKPEDVIKACEMACEQFDIEYKNIKIRFKNLPKTEKIRIRDIRSKDLGKLLYIEGIVKSRTDVRPQAASMRFECPSCGNIIVVLQLDTKLKEPTRCGCGRKGKFRMLSQELMDVQSLTVEEDVGELGEDSTPKKFKVLLKHDLTAPERQNDLIPPRPLRIIGQIKEVPVILRS